jgi:Flp pilus assembly protein TadD
LEFNRLVPSDPMMYVATAHACVAQGAWKEARHRLERALADAPNYPRARSLYGQVLAMSGDADRSFREPELASTLQHPAMWTLMLQTSIGHFAEERYEDAVVWARRAVVERPQVPMNHAALTAALAQLGATWCSSGARQRGPLHREPTHR